MTVKSGTVYTSKIRLKCMRWKQLRTYEEKLGNVQGRIQDLSEGGGQVF